MIITPTAYIHERAITITLNSCSLSVDAFPDMFINKMVGRYPPERIRDSLMIIVAKCLHSSL